MNQDDVIPIVDAHLDLAYNALRGREVLSPAAEQKSDGEGIPSVGVPDLQRGGVRLFCGTIFCEPDKGNTGKGYRGADEAHAMALSQLNWYIERAREVQLQLVDAAQKLPEGVNAEVPRMVVLLEGADAIRLISDVELLFKLGLRIVGLSWGRTRYAGGTGEPGPLTPEGIELVRELDRWKIIHDTSHLAEESFWQLLQQSDGPVLASHSNCRAIVNTDRQLSDEMISAIVARGGVIGMNFYDKFLLPAEELGTRRATIKDLIRHIRHICDLAGNARHVGIGSDMDGGFGRDRIPVEIADSGDLPIVAERLTEAGFSDDDVRNIMGENWLRFFRQFLAGTAQ